MKLEVDLREDDEWDHYVPLAPAAVEVLVTARSDWDEPAGVPVGVERARSDVDPISPSVDRLGIQQLIVPGNLQRSRFSISNGSFRAIAIGNRSRGHGRSEGVARPTLP